jgi:hypothetical protein
MAILLASIRLRRNLGRDELALDPNPTSDSLESSSHLLEPAFALAEAGARKLGMELALESFVVSSHTDGSDPWLPNSLTKRFISMRSAPGLAHFRLHDLRHFMASEMLDAGIPIATVSQRLSHVRASTMLNVYPHSIPGGRSESGRDSRGDPGSWAQVTTCASRSTPAEMPRPQTGRQDFARRGRVRRQ